MTFSIAEVYSIVKVRAHSREVRSTDSVTLNPGALQLTVEDKKRRFQLQLQPNNEVISSHFKMVVRGLDGQIESETEGYHGEDCLYKGYIKGKESTSTAALSTCNGRGFVSITNVSRLFIWDLIFLHKIKKIFKNIFINYR